MAKPLPARPEQDFRITSLGWQLEIEAMHRLAGFPPVSSDLLSRRFWQFLDFLQSNGLTSRIVVSGLTNMEPGTELRNSDLTDQGYLFAQRFADRWVGRMHKDTGELKEAAFLKRWLRRLERESGVVV